MSISSFIIIVACLLVIALLSVVLFYSLSTPDRDESKKIGLAGIIIRPIRRVVVDSETVNGGKSDLVLSGFSPTGAAINIPIDRRLLESSRWGLTFGRDGSLCDNAIPDDYGGLSRRHFRISWNGELGQYEIEDLRSAVGTVIDGKRLKAFEKTALRLPSKIDLGSRARFNLRTG